MKTKIKLPSALRIQGTGIPTWATIGLAFLAGVLQYLNQMTFAFGEPWSTLITAGLGAAAVFGITPMAHGALDNALHISYQEALLLGSVLATASTALSTVAMDDVIRSVLIAVLTTAAGMLAGPAPGSPVPPPAPGPAPIPAPVPAAKTKSATLADSAE